MKKIFLLFSFFLFSSQSFAWDTSDFKSELISPVTTDANTILYVGASLTIVTLIFEDQLVDPIQKEAVEDKPLGSFSKFGDLSGQVIPNAAYALGQLIAGYTGDVEGYRRSLGMFKATAYASLVTTTLKYSIREPRPGNKQEKNSFPSGHTTTAFAFSGYVLQEHGWAWGIPAIGIGVLTGLSRINDNRHYLHDVLAGATIGLSYGLAIAKLQKPNEASSFNIVPIYDHDTKGLVFIKSF